MLLAYWHRSGRAGPPSLLSRVADLVGDRSGGRWEGPNGFLAASAPGQVTSLGHGAASYAACDRQGAPLPGYATARWEGETLTLSVSHLPQAPLYFALAPDDSYLLACSQLAILAALLPEAPLNARRLVSLMAYGTDTDTATTVYAGIRRLRAGETVVADRELVRVSRAFPRVAGAYRRGKPRDLAAELLQRLDGAVARSMGSSSHVGVMVSGGLDSSGLLALAAAHRRDPTPRRLDAISIQCSGPGDDRPHMADLSRALDLVPVKLPARKARAWFRPSLCMDAQPGNLSSTCLFMMAGEAAVARGIDVVLTGVNGDNVSGGVLPFAALAQRARQGHLLAAVHAALRLRLPWPMGSLLRMRYVLSPMVPAAVRRLKRRLTPAVAPPAWATPRSRELMAESRAVDADADALLPESPDGQLECICKRSFLADGADAVGQLVSTTRCLPVDVFLDEDFVRFMVEIDPLLLSHGHQYRGLYRLAMKGLLPEPLRQRQDKGSFEAGVAAAAGDTGVEFLRELSSMDALMSRGLADPSRYRPVLDACLGALRRGDRDESGAEVPGDEHIQAVWQLLSVEAFLREHGRARELS